MDETRNNQGNNNASSRNQLLNTQILKHGLSENVFESNSDALIQNKIQPSKSHSNRETDASDSQYPSFEKVLKENLACKSDQPLSSMDLKSGLSSYDVFRATKSECNQVEKDSFRATDLRGFENLKNENLEESIRFDDTFDNLKSSSQKSSRFSQMNANTEDDFDQEIFDNISKLDISGDLDENRKVKVTTFKEPKTSSHLFQKGNTPMNLDQLINKTNLDSENLPDSFQNPFFKDQDQKINNMNAFNTPKRLSKDTSPIVTQFTNQSDDEENEDLFKEIEKFVEESKSETEEENLLRSASDRNETPNPQRINLIENDSDLNSSNKARKKPNLTLLSTESTIESDTLGTFDFNNSFSHPTNNSAGNIRYESFSPRTETLDSKILPKAPNSRLSLMSHPHLNQNSMSYFPGQNSGQNSERSNISGEDNLLQSFGSNYGTPQGRNHFNQSFNIGMSNSKMGQFFIGPQSMTPQYSNKLSRNDFEYSERKSFGPRNSNNFMIDSNRNKKKGQINEDQYEYQVDPNSNDLTKRTTLMIKNIPNKYDLALLVQTIDKNHKGKYDFLYLPIDFRNKCNVGYAFINFIEPRHVRSFHQEFHGKKWEKFNSEKICEIRYARIQGFESLVQHFKYSSVMNQQDKKLKPFIPFEHNKSLIESHQDGNFERHRRQSDKLYYDDH